MHSKSVLFVVASLAAFVTANPTTTITVTAPASTATSISQCNTGSAECCNTVQSASSPITLPFGLGLIDVVLSGVQGLVGLGCTPIDLLGILGPATCNQQAVCCTDTAFAGLINVGCNAITL